MIYDDYPAQVIVAGAGPTGLMLAGELRLAGVDVVVLERDSNRGKQSRALAMHARTVEALAQRGIANRLNGTVITRGHFAEISLDFSVLDGDYPGVMLIEQWRTENVLTQWAGELGAQIRRGHAVTGIVDRPGGIEVNVTGPDGEYTMAGRYLVGADGGHSTIRTLLGVEFPGTVATHEALVGDVANVPENLPRGFQRYDVGEIGVFPLEEGMTRVMAYVYDAPPRRDPKPPSFDELAANVRLISGYDISQGTASWVSRFGNAARQAAHYRRGQTFLAGDAAHIHSPYGGQGLNLGVQDAVNLGWKLAAAVHGWAPPTLLDSYHSERHPVASRVLFNTRAQDPLVGGPEVEPLRQYLTEIFAIPEVNERISGEMSGLDIQYGVGPGHHPLLGRRMPNHRLITSAGTRTSTTELLHGGRALLLDFSDGHTYEQEGVGWSDRIDIVGAAPSGLDPAEALLVRPDGYVAWVAGVGEPLQDALGRWFGNPTVPARI